MEGAERMNIISKITTTTKQFDLTLTLSMIYTYKRVALVDTVLLGYV